MASVKVGKKLVIDGTPYEVIKFEHVKVAQGKGLERTTLRNLVTGNTMQKTFRESDVVQEAEIITSNAEYLYSDEGQLTWVKGYCAPARLADMNSRNVVPADLKAKLPDPALLASSIVPSGDQLTKARAAVKDQWDKVVGLDIKPSK